MTPEYRTCTEHGEVEIGSKIVNGELVDTCPVCELIAAAPEGYGAAKITVNYFAATQPGRRCLADELNPCGGPGAPGTLTHWGEGDACPLCAARAAISKAEGRG